MSNRRLTAWVDGQEVLPVRALQYITTSARFKTDVFSRRFAKKDPFGRTWPLTAYHYLHEDASVWVPPNKWEEVVMRLDRFKAGLKERFPTGTEGYTLWSYEAVTVLPPCWYVLLDEFEKTFHADEGLLFQKIRPADHELNLSPIIDTHTRAMVMGCFETSAEDVATETHPGVPLLESVAQAESMILTPSQKTGFKRINENRAFLLDCEREGISMNIEAIWLHIRRNAGKDNFLIKTVSNETATTVEGKPVEKKNLGRVLADFLKARKTE